MHPTCEGRTYALKVDSCLLALVMLFHANMNCLKKFQVVSTFNSCISFVFATTSVMVSDLGSLCTQNVITTQFVY